MGGFAWKNDWAVGHKTIDGQHKQLFTAIDDLVESCRRITDKRKIHDMVKFLDDYTHKHFHEEEIIQEKHKYPDIQNHKNYHANFIKTVANIRKELDDKGPSLAIVGKIEMQVGSWLANHVTTQDIKVAKHVRENPLDDADRNETRGFTPPPVKPASPPSAGKTAVDGKIPADAKQKPIDAVIPVDIQLTNVLRLTGEIHLTGGVWKNG